MNLTVLGSTGSIGRQTLELARCFDDINITGLAAFGSIDLIEEQIKEFDPEICCIYDEKKASELKNRLGSGTGAKVKIVSGMEGLIECATYEKTDTVLISVVGMIGIKPTIEAIKAGKNIAQANKEPIVCAGHIIMPLAKKYGVSFTPVDSEHSAIYQCLRGEAGNKIDKIWLTASGGPFRGKKREELKGITPADALKHPSWNMGAKITIDSSTLVNKGLEVIEAHYLFDVQADDIIVAVQPGSIVHSMVQFEDGAIKAQLGSPDMKVPIAYALHKEHRVNYDGKKNLGFKELSEIRFMEPDLETFKGLKLGIEACRTEGTLTTVYNAANEECVSAFLAGKIGYLDITDGIEAAMRAHTVIPEPDLDRIFAAEKEARTFIKDRYNLN
ncbi:MAG: 1-deoxy-D-xylulose-5-phosphate reductoisomerase [Eubacteriales bacterium]|nr:1-deoxy-D-xylulose-5-phosphate reductoisomerase [Eubacteriales bacterium]